MPHNLTNLPAPPPPQIPARPHPSRKPSAPLLPSQSLNSLKTRQNPTDPDTSPRAHPTQLHTHLHFIPSRFAFVSDFVLRISDFPPLRPPPARGGHEGGTRVA